MILRDIVTVFGNVRRAEGYLMGAKNLAVSRNLEAELDYLVLEVAGIGDDIEKWFGKSTIGRDEIEREYERLFNVFTKVQEIWRAPRTKARRKLWLMLTWAQDDLENALSTLRRYI